VINSRRDQQLVSKMKAVTQKLFLRAPSRPCYPTAANLAFTRRRPPFGLTRRFASTDRERSTATSRLLNVFYGASLLLGLGIIYVYITDTRAGVHRWIVVPALRLIYREPEDAHRFGNQALKTLWEFGLHPRERGDPDKKQDLSVEVFGHVLSNPIATSAGIDKQAEIPDALFDIGPAIIEIGGTTPLPQPGNEKPRVFRLASQNALINRYGLNSEGADHVALRLRNRVRKFAHSLGLGQDEAAEQFILDGRAGVPPGSLIEGKLLAVNIAKNKTTPEDDVEAVTKDYVYCVEKLGPYADILVVNVSSPNTPGLRSLQQSDKLKQILHGVVQAANAVNRATKPAVMVKVSPDEDSDDQIAGICDAVWLAGVDGVIVGNTTNRRPEPLPHLKHLTPREEGYLLEQGGFSGPHLFGQTVALVKKYKQSLTQRPPALEALSRRKTALEAEADRIKTSIQASTGISLTENPDQDPVTAFVDAEAIPTNLSEPADSETQPSISTPTEPTESETGQGPSKTGDDDAAHKIEQIEHVTIEEEQLESIEEALAPLLAEAEQDALDKPKVIFATGGITNGKQALEVLNAGATVAMVYTALVYGGVGTISRIKREMRQEIKEQVEDKKQQNH